MEHQLDRREFLKKLVGVGALYTTGAAGLLLPKDVVAATSMADFWSRDRTINCKRADTGENMKSVFFNNKMDMILKPTVMPVG